MIQNDGYSANLRNALFQERLDVEWCFQKLVLSKKKQSRHLVYIKPARKVNTF